MSFYASYSNLMLDHREILGTRNPEFYGPRSFWRSFGHCCRNLFSLKSHPFEYFKTKSQLRAEGIGMRQKSINMGVNFVKVFYQFMEAGYSFCHVYTGYHLSD